MTHRLDEVARSADRATVLHDGRHVRTFPVAAVEPRAVVEMITGTTSTAAEAAERPRSGRALLEVSGLGVDGVHDLSFTVHEGEIVGIAGLLGSGRSTVLEALFGARTGRPDRSPSAVHRSTSAPLHGPWRQAWPSCPSERERAVFPGQSLAENLSIADLPGFQAAAATAGSGAGAWTGPPARRGRRRRGPARHRGRLHRPLDRHPQRREPAEGRAGPLDAPHASPAPARRAHPRRRRGRPRRDPRHGPSLRPRLPRRARSGLRAARTPDSGGAHTADGRAALLVSSDVEELCAIADRILVLRGGRLAHELDTHEVTPDAVNQLVHQGALT